jgi:hypothetical protein
MISNLQKYPSLSITPLQEITLNDSKRDLAPFCKHIANLPIQIQIMPILKVEECKESYINYPMAISTRNEMLEKVPLKITIANIT